MKSQSIFLLLLTLNFSILSKEITIKESGFYCVYVKRMSFWNFWNHHKIFKALAEVAETNVDSICVSIYGYKPIVFVWKWWEREKYEEVLQLKEKLQKLHCELEIREIAITCDDQDDLPGMIEWFKFNEPLQKALQEYTPDPNLTEEEKLHAHRLIVLEALKKDG